MFRSPYIRMSESMSGGVVWLQGGDTANCDQSHSGIFLSNFQGGGGGAFEILNLFLNKFRTF